MICKHLFSAQEYSLQIKLIQNPRYKIDKKKTEVLVEVMAGKHKAQPS